MNRFAAAAWTLSAIAWALVGIDVETLPETVAFLLIALASSYMAALYRRQENR